MLSALNPTHTEADLKVFIAGDAELLKHPCVSVIGTRDVSAEGAARARRVAKELVQRGTVVVSGLAEGVDTEAMTAAIAHGGRTVGVIGTPLNKAYPAKNAALQEEVYRNHLLVSQFPEGATTFKSSFPQRNRLMAFLSDASVIIEASDTSGTLHQAAECQRLGRWLFIAKSVADNPDLKWPKSFLGQPKTAILERTEDILRAIGSEQAA
jgi:DNA processing protein